MRLRIRFWREEKKNIERHTPTECRAGRVGVTWRETVLQLLSAYFLDMITNTKLRLTGRLFQKRCPSYLFPFQPNLTPPFRTREDGTNDRDGSGNLTLQGIKRKLPVIFKLSDFEEKHVSASCGTAAQSDATAPSCSRIRCFLTRVILMSASLLFLPTSGTVAGARPPPRTTPTSRK